MPNCIISRCPHGTKKSQQFPGVVMHGFPNDIRRIKEWLQSTKQPFQNLEALCVKIYEGKPIDLFRMCSAHFTQRSYTYTKLKRFLRHDAIPTIFPDVEGNKLINEEVVMASGKKRKTQTPSSGLLSGSSQACPQCGKSDNCRPEKTYANVETQTDLCNINFPGYISETQQTLGQGEYSLSLREHAYNHGQCPPIPMRQEKPQTLVPNLEQPRLDFLFLLQSPILATATAYQAFIPPAVEVGGLVDTQGSKVNSIFPLPQQVQEKGRLGTTSTITNPSEQSSAGPECKALRELKEEMLESEMTPTPSDLISEAVIGRKLLVFEECLDKLIYLVKCQHPVGCNKTVTSFNKHYKGFAVIIRGRCEDGHCFKIWESQPRVGRFFAGNVLTATAVFCTGLNPKKVYSFLKTLGVKQIAERTYLKYQKTFCFPAIHNAWEKEQEKITDKISGNPVALAGNGRCDRPGRNATYCLYSMMDTQSEQIIDFEVVQSTQASCSVAMKEFGFERCMSRADKKGLDLEYFVSDHHVDIKKVMRENYSAVNHQFDVCCFAKSIAKKLHQASKTKLCANIRPWIDTIYSHFWWAVKNCNNREDQLRRKWLSVLHHIVNEHTWEEFGTQHRCDHGPLSEQTVQKSLWLQRGTPAYETIEAIVTDDQLLSEFKHLTWNCHTASLEIYHRTVLKFCTKLTQFGIDHMETRVKLAALTHNNNVSRKTARIKYELKKRSAKVDISSTKLLAPKKRKRWDVRSVFEDYNFDNLIPIMEDSLRICEGSKSSSWISRTALKTISNISRPAKEEAVW